MKKKYTIYQRHHYGVRYGSDRIVYMWTQVSLEKPELLEYDELEVYEIEVEEEYVIGLINKCHSSAGVGTILRTMIKDYQEEKKYEDTRKKLLDTFGVGL